MLGGGGGACEKCRKSRRKARFSLKEIRVSRRVPIKYNSQHPACGGGGLSVDGSDPALCHKVALHQRFEALLLPLQQRLVAAAARLGIERVMPLLFRRKAGVPGC